MSGRFRFGAVFWLSVAWVTTLAMLALFADILPLQDPLKSNYMNPFETPSATFILGTDEIGRDIFSRVIYGARISLTLALLAPALALLIALPLGVLAGYFKGRVEGYVGIFNDSLLAFPNIVLAIVIVNFVGASILSLTLVLASFALPHLIRIAKSTTLMFSDRAFVESARALGASHFRVIWRELLPNVMLPMVTYMTLSMSMVITLEGILSFLGFSIPPPTPTWGRMIASGFDHIELSPHITFMPSIIMFLTVLSLNLVGDRLMSMGHTREAAI